MTEKVKKEINDLEVSMGLLAGYILAATADVLIFDTAVKETFSKKRIKFWDLPGPLFLSF